MRAFFNFLSKVIQNCIGFKDKTRSTLTQANGEIGERVLL